MDQVLEAVGEQNAHKALEWSQAPEWQTVEQILHMDGGKLKIENQFSKVFHNTSFISKIAHGMDHQSSDSFRYSWACKACTFVNPNDATECQICQTRKN